LDATTGEAAGPVVRPEAVVTLALPKTGLRSVDGRMFLADIGLPSVVFERAGIEYEPPFRGEYVVEIEPAR
ncbi:MAG TPA: NAD(P)H-hydrate epimerase, partial [Halobacteriales archaeon]|nr:NAD(P)H-hydrate epimerase [Halobacteriales archaeon]